MWSMPGTVTQARLIEVAIDQFGRHGLEAVTTRGVAEAAGVQQSAISYHFGSKERLHLACAEHIASLITEKTAPLVGHADVDDPELAAARIENILGGLAVIMMHDDIAPMARFVVREQMNPTPAFAVLYDRAMRRVVETLMRHLEVIAPGRFPTETLRVRCIALMGQVFAFRFARAALMQVTAWQTVGPRETALVRDTVIAHTRAVLADLRDTVA
jgi:AcrR family transcriptional regulator